MLRHGKFVIDGPGNTIQVRGGIDQDVELSDNAQVLVGGLLQKVKMDIGDVLVLDLLRTQNAGHIGRDARRVESVPHPQSSSRGQGLPQECGVRAVAPQLK